MKPDWKPITTPPPKPDFSHDRYMIQTRYGTLGFGEYYVSGDWFCYDWDGDLMNVDDIVAWSPLPEQYKEIK